MTRTQISIILQKIAIFAVIVYLFCLFFNNINKEENAKEYDTFCIEGDYPVLFNDKEVKALSVMAEIYNVSGLEVLDDYIIEEIKVYINRAIVVSCLTLPSNCDNKEIEYLLMEMCLNGIYSIELRNNIPVLKIVDGKPEIRSLSLKNYGFIVKKIELTDYKKENFIVDKKMAL